MSSLCPPQEEKSLNPPTSTGSLNLVLTAPSVLKKANGLKIRVTKKKRKKKVGVSKRVSPTYRYCNTSPRLSVTVLREGCSDADDDGDAIMKSMRRPAAGLPDFRSPSSSLNRHSTNASPSVFVDPSPNDEDDDDEFWFFDDDNDSTSAAQGYSDTLMALRSIEQSQQCLYIPLKSAVYDGNSHINSLKLMFVPAVLESQLYARLACTTSTMVSSTVGGVGGATSCGGDSVVTRELQELLQSHQLIRLASLEHPCHGHNNTNKTAVSKTVAWMESKHYRRAVWDAHRYHSTRIMRMMLPSSTVAHNEHDVDNKDDRQAQHDPQTSPPPLLPLATATNSITQTQREHAISWFLSPACLRDVVAFGGGGRLIRHTDLRQSWFRYLQEKQKGDPHHKANKQGMAVMSSAMSSSDALFSKALDWLLEIQVLMPYNDGGVIGGNASSSSSSSSASARYVLWLPAWGQVLKYLERAQRNLMAKLKRSHTKELSVSNVVTGAVGTTTTTTAAGLSGKFVLDTLVANGQLRIVNRPAGNFVKLVSC